MLDIKSLLPDNVQAIFSGEETMPNKLVVIFSFTFLAIIPAFAASPEQPNSVPSDQNSLQTLIDNANKGDANAQFNLGRCYDKGVGVEQDYNEATKWFTKAAEQGNVKAQGILGFMFNEGQGVTQDYKEAMKWYKKAAEQGDAPSQFMTGLMFYEGQGVKQDYKEAVKWYTKAAEQGFAGAQCVLGLMFRDGQGVTRDYKEEVRWLTKAAEQGQAEAQLDLGVCYYNGQGVKQYYKEAAKCFRKAAEQGNAQAQCNLGVLFYNGQGVTQDYKEAAKWYTKAAEQGNTQAQHNLAVMLDKNQDVAQSYKEGIQSLTNVEQTRDDRPTNLVITDAASVLADYEDNVIGADKKYKNKLIAIRGAIGNIGRDEDGAAYVALAVPGNAEDAIKCSFDNKDEDQIANLHFGDIVTIAGLCDKGGVLFFEKRKHNMVNMYNCWVYNGKALDSKHERTITSQESPLKIIEATSLIQAYEESPDLTDLTLIHKRIAVRGYVLRIMWPCVWLGDKDTFQTVKRPDLGFEASVQTKPIVACCFEREEQASKIMSKTGDIVTIVGTCLGKPESTGEPGSIMITGCSMYEGN